MNKTQLEHYLAGGKFKGIYNPKSLDIDTESMLKIGNEIEVFQNMIITPIVDIEKWKGQFRFNSDSIYGWFPEEDVDDLEIISDFKYDIKSLPVYMYKMTYLNKDSIRSNFGKGNFSIPLIVSREYSSEKDEYVLNELSSPKADIVEKFVWNGELIDEIKWKGI